MKKLTSFADIKVGDKLLEVETIAGPNGDFGGGMVYPLTVTKVTCKKVYVNNDYFNCGYAFRKEGDLENRGFYYGKRTELYIPDPQGKLPSQSLMLGE